MAGVAAGALGFLIFNHAFDGLDLYGALSFFEIFIAGQSYFPNPSLVPPSSAVPTAAEKQQYDDDDDQKGCVVHIVLLKGSWRR
jgi:hypothetical protein